MPLFAPVDSGVGVRHARNLCSWPDDLRPMLRARLRPPGRHRTRQALVHVDVERTTGLPRRGDRIVELPPGPNDLHRLVDTPDPRHLGV